ncbi:NUDIX hydrolase [Sphingomonas adhaesiva]|jgi:8-oxo-dGTP diphosphatase|nr:NUDIX domain-containing protein [Sphingomonas adhaesiva]
MTDPIGAAVAVGAIIARDGRLLLGLRSPYRRRCPGRWDLPGGHVEDGETVVEAARRELMEEIGIIAERIGLLVTLNLLDVGGRPMLLSIMRVAEWRGSPTLRDHEHVALGWFTPDAAAELPDLAVDAYRPVFGRLRLNSF